MSGLLGALNSGVSGLFAQTQKLGAISDNISNSSTVGYKKSGVDFATLVTGSAGKSYTPGGVDTTSRRFISKDGMLRTSTSATDLAISGRGFFVVKADGVNTANEADMLTRAGSFRLDEKGYLRNAATFYLQGWPISQDGTVQDGQMASVKMEMKGSDPEPTTAVDFTANLPAQLSQSVPVGAPVSTGVEYIDELGSAQLLNLTWTPTAANTWNLTVTDRASGSTVYDSATAGGGGDIVFDTAGATAGRPTGIPGTVAGVATLALPTGQNITLDVSQISQFAGNYAPTFDKDGLKSGDLVGVDVGEDGLVYAVYDNGQRQAKFKLAIGDVTNPDGLTPVDGNAYTISRTSGTLNYRKAGEGPVGTVSSYALEGSNVDIAEELTALIETQRAYSSNAKIITTSDEMLDEATRLKR
jgi:flagellar hook protein FlgE